jgi:sulfur carrier protein
MVTINGIQKEGYENVCLSDVLSREGYETKRIAVEINGEIVSRTKFEETLVKEGDCMEVVSFVGGG